MRQKYYWVFLFVLLTALSYHPQVIDASKDQTKHRNEIGSELINVQTTEYGMGHQKSDIRPVVKTYTVDGSKKVDGNIDMSGQYLMPTNILSGGTSILMDSKEQLHIVYETEKEVYLVMYDRSLKVKKRLTFKKEWINFGDITLDHAGNYYILWGRPLKESDYRSSSIMIVKYDSTGKKVKATTWNGKSIDTKEPFNSGNARIIYQNGVVVAHFARLMFKHSDGLNHQASQVVYLNTKTMKQVKQKQPYISHSFNQQVLPLKDGNVLFVDQGDGYPRGFGLNHLAKNEMTEFTPFHFKEGGPTPNGYNYTFAQLGGIAEGKVGYALLGSSEKTLSAAPASSSNKESRNLFLQFFKTDISRYSETQNIEDLFLVKGTTRKLVGKRSTSGSGRYFLESGTIDRNVRWITNYRGDFDAGNPKIISTSDGRYIVMWEEFEKHRFKRVRMQIFSTYGETLSKVIEVPNVRLPVAEDILYNRGYLYWTTIKSKLFERSGVVSLHRLKVN